MKRFFTLFVLSALAYAGVANAQATVESATPKEQVAFANEVKTEKDAPAYKSEAQIKAEKAAIRKELDEVLALRCTYSVGDPAVTVVTIR